jgi:RimJ/RimL family protein N-acetyltransferase
VTRPRRPAQWPEELTLPDGTPALLWPLLPSDRELLRETYRQLSPTSRYQRFLTAYRTVPEALLDRLVRDVDGTDHVALLLLALPPDEPEQVAGLARIIRCPDRPGEADVAVTVVHAWRRRGVGATLLRALLRHRPDGVHRLVTQVAVDNAASLAMLAGAGRLRTSPPHCGVLDVRVELPGNPAFEPRDGTRHTA